MKRVIILSLLLTGCGDFFSCGGKVSRTVATPTPAACQLPALFTKLEKDISFQVGQFSADAIRYQASCYHTIKGTIDETFPAKIEPSVIGYCQPSVHLAIRKSYWMRASATERMTLIYHEMGHCALGLDHEDDKPDIMNSYLLDESIADREWDSLIKILFERAKNGKGN